MDIVFLHITFKFEAPQRLTIPGFHLALGLDGLTTLLSKKLLTRCCFPLKQDMEQSTRCCLVLEQNNEHVWAVCSAPC